MCNDELKKILDHYLSIEGIHGSKINKGNAFYEHGTLSLRSLEIQEYVTFSELFFTSNLGLGNVTTIEFINCIFKKDVTIRNDNVSVLIKDCLFESKLYINEQSVNNELRKVLSSFVIVDTICKGNFKLHNCEVASFLAQGTDFNSNADFFKSTISTGCNDPYQPQTENKEILFETLNFDGLVLFGGVRFESIVLFKYVTFKDYVHFKDAIFKKGVNLDYANIGKEINFFNVRGLDSNISKIETSQETYRIIKHQLRRVGNIIDSNKYHALELEKKRLSSSNNNLLDYLVLQLHWVSSKHSQNWLIPIIWIFVTGGVTAFSLNYLGCCTHKNFLLEIFNYMSIMNTDKCLKSNPIVFLLSKLSLSYLYYQFLTVVRKDTKI